MDALRFDRQADAIADFPVFRRVDRVLSAIDHHIDFLMNTLEVQRIDDPLDFCL